MSQCPDDGSRILVKVYEDDFVLVERVLGELFEVQSVLET